MEPLGGLDLKRRHGLANRRARVPARRAPLPTVHLLHEEALLLFCPLVVPALPFASEVHVHLPARVGERDAVADSLGGRRLRVPLRERPISPVHFSLSSGGTRTIRAARFRFRPPTRRVTIARTLGSIAWVDLPA